MIEYRCPCGKEYSLREELLDKKVRCYACQRVGVVAWPSPTLAIVSESATILPATSTFVPANSSAVSPTAEVVASGIAPANFSIAGSSVAEQLGAPVIPSNAEPTSALVTPEPEKKHALPSISEWLKKSAQYYLARFVLLAQLEAIGLLLIYSSFIFLALGIWAGGVFIDWHDYLVAVGGILSVVAVLYAWGLGMMLIVAGAFHPEPSLLNVWKVARWHVSSFVWVALLFGVLVGGGMLLFFIPGLLFLVWFSLAPFILLSEDLTGMQVLVKSRALILGWTAPVFARVFLLIFVGVALHQVPFIGSILVALYVPFVFCALAWVYQDLMRLHPLKDYQHSHGSQVRIIGFSLLGYVVAPLMVLFLAGSLLWSTWRKLKKEISPWLFESPAAVMRTVQRPSSTRNFSS